MDPDDGFNINRDSMTPLLFQDDKQLNNTGFINNNDNNNANNDIQFKPQKGNKIHQHPRPNDDTNNPRTYKGSDEHRRTNFDPQDRKKILNINPEEDIRETKGRYYIISLVVPLVVFLFALVVLCFFIMSPILQGFQARNSVTPQKVPPYFVLASDNRKPEVNNSKQDVLPTVSSLGVGAGVKPPHNNHDHHHDEDDDDEDDDGGGHDHHHHSD